MADEETDYLQRMRLLPFWRDQLKDDPAKAKIIVEFWYGFGEFIKFRRSVGQLDQPNAFGDEKDEESVATGEEPPPQELPAAIPKQETFNPSSPPPETAIPYERQEDEEKAFEEIPPVDNNKPPAPEQDVFPRQESAPDPEVDDNSAQCSLFSHSDRDDDSVLEEDEPLAAFAEESKEEEAESEFWRTGLINDFDRWAAEELHVDLNWATEENLTQCMNLAKIVRFGALPLYGLTALAVDVFGADNDNLEAFPLSFSYLDRFDRTEVARAVCLCLFLCCTVVT